MSTSGGTFAMLSEDQSDDGKTNETSSLLAGKHSYPDGGNFDDMFQGIASSQMTTAGTLMVSDFYWTFRDITFYTDFSFVFAMIGIALMIAAKEMRYYGNPEDTKNNLIVLILRCFQSITTACLLYCLFCTYRVDWRFIQLNRQFLKQISIWTSDRLISFILECAICIIHEPPFWDTDIDIALPEQEQGLGGSPLGPVLVRNPFALLMFCRIYLIVRLILVHYYTGGTKILGVWHHFEFNIPFAIRNMLHSHPFKTLLFAGVILATTTSYSLHVCERETGGIHDSLAGSFWIILITMPAVGYGDMFAVTLCGRGVSLVAAMCGVLLVAVVTATVYSMLSLMPYESRMVEFLESAESRSSLVDLASSVIAKAWRAYKARNAHPAVRLLARRDLILTIDVFYATRLQVMAHDSRYQNNQLFRALLERIQGDVDILVRHMSQRARALREEQAQARKANAAQGGSDSGSDTDSQSGDSDAEDGDGKKKDGDGASQDGDAEEKKDEEKKDDAGDAASADANAAGGAAGATGVPALKSTGKQGSMAALAATVPASTATVLRAQLPKMVEHVMATMKTQLQDVHGQVKSLHSRLDRLETQLSDTRGLLKAQTGISGSMKK